MHMKECKGKNPSAHLLNAIKYIMDVQKGHSEEKTLGGKLVISNSGIKAEEIYETMMMTKMFYKKNWGRSGYHFVLSFPAGEATAEDARDITEEFAERYLKNNYDYVVAAHDDQEHKHGHLIFNSISREGMKYRYEFGDWEKEIQPIVNDLCKERNLSFIELGQSEDKQKVKDYKKWENTQGHKSWANLIRQNIDEAIEHSDTYEEMMQMLRNSGYQIREGNSKKYGAYISLKAEGMERARRNYSLGKGYSVEDIRKRILDKSYMLEERQAVPDMTPYILKLKEIYYPMGTRSKMTYEYLRKCLFLCHWNNRLLYPYKNIQVWKYRKDLKELDSHMDNIEFAARYEINTLDELRDIRDMLEVEAGDIKDQIKTIGKGGDAVELQEMKLKLKKCIRRSKCAS